MINFPCVSTVKCASFNYRGNGIIVSNIFSISSLLGGVVRGLEVGWVNEDRPAGIGLGGLDVHGSAMAQRGSLLAVFVVGSTLLGASFFLARLAAAGVFFFFKVNLVTVFVDDLVLEVVERLVG